MAKKAKKIKHVKGWCGVDAGCVAEDEIAEYGYSEQPIGRFVFKTRRDARKRYECIIPVLIVPITPKRRKKK